MSTYISEWQVTFLMMTCIWFFLAGFLLWYIERRARKMLDEYLDKIIEILRWQERKKS